MAAELNVHDELEGSASPPGRESREDWRGGENRRNGRSPLGDRKRHSRSRSPRWKRRSSYSPGREMRYAREGTNTTSREPHLERARLFVGNIEPNRTHRRDLIKLFSQYGDVLGVSVHKGYAFVQMDRERTANKAINFEDNHTFMGSRIHVEFSQAAIKAGAKFERLPTSPPRDRDRGTYYPPPPPPPHPESYLLDDQERQREERLARILQMEREIAMLREGGVDTRRSRLPDPHDSYDRRERDGYRRSPPPMNSHGYDSYDRRDRDSAPYRGGGGGGGGGIGGGGGRAGYYGRSSPPRDHTSRGGGGGGGSSNDGPYRDAISYPAQYGGSSGSGGSGGYSRSPPTVGYSTTGMGGKNSALPPGWPSSDHDKSSLNRPPFTAKGPWS